MNRVRKCIDTIMRATRLDARIDASRVNLWIERRRARTHPSVSAAAGNDWLRLTIESGRPAAVGKLGDRECCALAARLRIARFYKYTWCPPTYGEADLFRQAGVFPPTNDVFARFSDLLLERLADLDGCGTWQNPGEHQLLLRRCPRAFRFDLPALDPWFHPRPWSSALRGKRVLVVHPFEDSIRRQFARREALWPTAPDVLPPLELETIRAPYGFGSNGFKDWFEMLAWLEARVAELHALRPIDVALIGCGGAGIPLASFVKKLGAIGVHMGGPSQLLFGIRGNRWDARPEYAPFFNSSWIRPAAHETPDCAPKVDKAGYW